MDEMVTYYDSIQYPMSLDLLHLITGKDLSKYSNYFQGHAFDPDWRFVNDKGQAKLKKEFPDIWEEFELDESAPTVST